MPNYKNDHSNNTMQDIELIFGYLIELYFLSQHDKWAFLTSFNS